MPSRCSCQMSCLFSLIFIRARDHLQQKFLSEVSGGRCSLPADVHVYRAEFEHRKNAPLFSMSCLHYLMTIMMIGTIIITVVY